MRAGFTHFAKRSYVNTKSKQKKRRPWLLRPLRFATGQPVVLGPDGVKNNSPSAQTSFCPDPSGPPLLGAYTRGPKPNIQTPNIQFQYKTRTRRGVSLWFRYSGFFLRLFGCSVFRVPLCMRRGAQVQADQGSRCLSVVKRSEFSETPPEPSTAGCPERSAGTQEPGSPFLLLTFLLAKQKKSKLPPGNPRPAPSAENTREAKEEEEEGKRASRSKTRLLRRFRFLDPSSQMLKRLLHLIHQHQAEVAR
jgi:hypothetical protein